MRAAIFLGLICIALQIRDNNVSDSSYVTLAVITVCMFGMDIIEFFNNLFKQNQ